MYKKLAESVRKCRRIFVLTGAGLSAPSNIPTFRGEDGMWTTMATNGMEPTELLTKMMLDTNAKLIWNWFVGFNKLLNIAKPNEGHKALLKWQEHCKIKDIDFTLVTQNIDNFHSQLIRNSSILKPNLAHKEGTYEYGFTDGLIEIHGNASYMRCNEECSHGFYAMPKALDYDMVPRCKKCGKNMRPHTLMFDEVYRDDYYQSLAAVKRAHLADCMLIIGSELQTHLPNVMAYEHVYDNKLTIEINPRQVINCDGSNVVSISESCEKSLPALIGEITQN